MTFFSPLSLTLAANETIQRTVSSIIRIPVSQYPCIGVGNSDLRGKVILDSNPFVFDIVDIQLLPSKICLIDGSQTTAYASDINWPFNPGGVVIRGVFEVDNGSIFEYAGLSQSNRSFIVLEPGSVINIASKGECYLRDVDIFGCTQMWQGFRVWGLLHLQRVLLSGAEYGVQAYHNSKLSFRDSRFINNYVGFHIPNPQPITSLNQIQISAFHGNEFATEEQTLLPPYPGQQATIEDVGFAGVWIHKMPDANLSGIKTPDFAKYNSYKSLANGIISIQSNLIVKNSWYEDILQLEEGHPYPYSGRGIYSFTKLYNGLGKLEQAGLGENENSDATFKNCTYGIFVEGTYGSIRKNKMELMETGIEIRYCLQKVLWVEDNRIEASRRGISAYQNFESGGAFANNEIFVHNPEGPDDGAGIVSNNNMIGLGWYIGNNAIYLSRALQGIAVRNTQYSSIKNNSIYMDLFGIGKERYIGISLEGGFAASVDCNALYGNAVGNNYKLATGIYLMGNADTWAGCNEMDDTRYGLQAYGLCDGSQLKGNDWGNHWNGLLLGQYLSGGGYDGDAFLGIQSHFGNLWTQMQSSGANTTDDRYGAVHLSDDIDIVSFSKFIVDEAENQAFMPEVGLLNLQGGQPEDWFFDEAEVTQSFSCQVENLCPQGTGINFGLTEFDYQIAGSLLQTEKYTPAQKWTATRHLYRRLLTSPALIQANTLIDTFFTETAQTSAGEHEDMARSIAGIFYLDTTQAGEIALFESIISEGLGAIVVLDSLLTDSLSYQDSIAITDQRLAWQDSLVQVSALQDSIFQDLSDAWKQDAQSLLFGTGSLPDTAQYEENQQIVQDIILDKLAEGNLILDSLQTDQLEAIASQCPLSGGDAVFEARALLDKGVYDDAALCNGYGQNAASKVDDPEDEIHVIKAIPNPAYQGFTLILPWFPEKVTNGRLQISDQLGRIQIDRTVKDNVSQLSFESASWPSGLYACKLVLENGKVLSTFILIQHY